MIQEATLVQHSIAAALLRRFPSARLLEVAEGGCRFVCAEPVTAEAIEEEMAGASPAERVEMMPKVAVGMFRHVGQPELAAQVPTDRQLVELTRIGSYYGFGFAEGSPREVQLQIDWQGPVGKISPLPYEAEAGKICHLESHATA
jgi:hypothetical protein